MKQTHLIPRFQRPWGVITWLADVFGTSRETIYTIGLRAQAGLFLPVVEPPSPVGSAAMVEPASSDVPTIAVTDNRVKRTILIGLFPGRMDSAADRGLAKCGLR